jgi:hypothetical protein
MARPQTSKTPSDDTRLTEPSQKPAADPEIAVLRNGEPLLLLTIDPKETLAELRRQLLLKGGVLPTDVFTDAAGFAVSFDEEDKWTVGQLIARSDGETLNLRSTERRPRERPSPPEPSLEAPTLAEAYEHDLTIPEHEWEERKDIPVPLRGVAINGEAKDPIRLDAADWSDLVARNQLTSGIRMDLPIPRPSFFKAFDILGGVPRFVVWDESEVSTTITHTERELALVKSKFVKAEVSASYSFVSGSVSGSHRTRTSSDSKTQHTRVTGSWDYPRVIVQLAPEDIAPTLALTEAIAKALDPESKSNEDRFYALSEVFDRFGHVWATEVTLGGQLNLSDDQQLDDTLTQAETESAMRAAISAKVGAAKGSASGEASTGQNTQTALLERLQNTQLTATGGDTRLVEDSTKWTSTVGPAHNWRVIRRSGLRPLYEVLDDELKRKVRNVLEKVDPRMRPTIFEPAPLPAEPFNQVIRADRDGLLLTKVEAAENKGGRVAGCCGPGGVPAHRVAYAFGVNIPGKGWNDLRMQTMTLPVRRGDSYLVDRLSGEIPEPCVQFHTTVDAGKAIFDPCVSITNEIIKKDWKAVSSGLLVVAAHATTEEPTASNSFGDRCPPSEVAWSQGAEVGGNVVLQVKAEGEDQYEPVASTTAYVRWFKTYPADRATSMCVPVLAGCTYSVTYQPRDVLMSSEVWFTPINPASAIIDPPLDRSTGTDDDYIADTDGILLCWLSQDTNTVIEVLTAPDRATLTAPDRATLTPIARASVGGDHKDWPSTTVTVPIRQGHFYRVNLKQGDKAFAGKLRNYLFFPFTRY